MLSMKPGGNCRDSAKHKGVTVWTLSDFFFPVAMGYLESGVQSPETQQDICRRHQWSVTEIFQAGQRRAAPYLRSKTWTPTRKINWRIYFGCKRLEDVLCHFLLVHTKHTNTCTEAAAAATGTSTTAQIPPEAAFTYAAFPWAFQPRCWYYSVMVTYCHRPCKRQCVISVKL